MNSASRGKTSPVFHLHRRILEKQRQHRPEVEQIFPDSSKLITHAVVMLSDAKHFWPVSPGRIDPKLIEILRVAQNDIMRGLKHRQVFFLRLYCKGPICKA